MLSLVRFRRRPGQLGDGIAIEGNLPLKFSGQLFLLLSFCSSAFTATTSTTGWAAWFPSPMTTPPG